MIRSNVPITFDALLYVDTIYGFIYGVHETSVPSKVSTLKANNTFVLLMSKKRRKPVFVDVEQINKRGVIIMVKTGYCIKLQSPVTYTAFQMYISMHPGYLLSLWTFCPSVCLNDDTIICTII